MAGITGASEKMTTLEELARGKSKLHSLSALTKVIITFTYIILVVSFSPYEVSALVTFILYPVTAIAIADLPYSLLLKRLSVALPFSFLAGIFSLIYNKRAYLYLGPLAITYGMLSFISILLKTALTVMAVMVLIGTTPLEKISTSLTALHLPKFLTTLLEMTYRYLSILIEEAVVIYHAYILRSRAEKGVKLNDMGMLLGGLLLRTISRGERIYEAMVCRGYKSIDYNKKLKHIISAKEFVLVLFFMALGLTARLINISELIGGLFQ